MESDLITKLIVLEAQHDATTSTRNSTSSFSIDLNNGAYGVLKDVIGIKLYSFEIVPRDGASFVPVTNKSVYIVINSCANVVTGISSIPTAFARVSVSAQNGSSIYSMEISGSLDPWTYMYDPIVPKLSKFNVSLVTSDGVAYDTKNNNVIVTLAVYMKCKKYSQS